MQELQDKLAEQQADVDEVGEVFAQGAMEGNAEAEDMLAQMLAEDAIGEMEAVPAPGMG